ncbi:type II toxin-antitoxin system RelE/ParE family toxin [Dolichospermum sp. ST_con]|nr:type II toxin-antitoxin system RelE/ParE family toxin [Dolichospermum sp. ST_con]MDD1422026.1 type II toxin-antitoxin system RelE/ParE family toxin [Dolichospermum sp. ST_sed1]MDD1424601.1 type II toxin-antitoxin system RelE/ParE family toxin [Dolichospermum sp. ST_sed9]MDD1432263.1 type II toxin-antitoxin system RelE/ParE family toxin [Dolichospermum sp. ST_sed6]MDD1440323.1 type II toxin-antitoxin system RelE/ParE family toxin [Dolichospermum sp. ST_sed3]MDD1446871.1 type II toxin-antitox
MQNESFLINIDLTPEYQRNLKYLAKKYRNIRSDTQLFITELQQGNLLGDRLTGFGEDVYIYKARVKNSNIQKGKSAGYRIIYLRELETNILLLTIYSKSEQEDITDNEINFILEEFYRDE